MLLEPPHCASATSAQTQDCCHGGRDSTCGLVSITSNCSLQKKQDDSPDLNEHFLLGSDLTEYCFLTEFPFIYLFSNINFPWTFPHLCYALAGLWLSFLLYKAVLFFTVPEVFPVSSLSSHHTTFTYTRAYTHTPLPHYIKIPNKSLSLFTPRSINTEVSKNPPWFTQYQVISSVLWKFGSGIGK